jgi:hypothetical protein
LNEEQKEELRLHRNCSHTSNGKAKPNKHQKIEKKIDKAPKEGMRKALNKKIAAAVEKQIDKQQKQAETEQDDEDAIRKYILSVVDGKNRIKSILKPPRDASASAVEMVKKVTLQNILERSKNN